MSLALARHDEPLHTAVKFEGGNVFKHTGDGVCAAFPTAPAAVAAALAAQEALLAEDWPEPGPLRVRMALHSGTVEQRDADFFGPPLNRTARLLSTAHGGQVILSLVTAELVRESLPDEAELLDLGEHRLADLSRPERVYQLTHPELPATFPALRSLTTRRHNLPIAASSFVGREQELVAVTDLIRSSRGRDHPGRLQAPRRPRGPDRRSRAADPRRHRRRPGAHAAGARRLVGGRRRLRRLPVRDLPAPQRSVTSNTVLID